MDVYVANFGRGNYDWPKCLELSCVSTLNSERSHRYWVSGDKKGFIDHSIAEEKTAIGEVPTRAVASRWYGLMTAVADTTGDIWIHRAKDRLWWTISLETPATIKLEVVPKSPDSYVCRKPCLPWSNTNKLGSSLIWNGLHPKATSFLFTRGTHQKLNSDYARYAIALLEGSTLDDWHNRASWQQAVDGARKAPGNTATDRQIAVANMAYQAMQTAAASNGQSVERKIKNKDCDFKDETSFRDYVANLLREQNDLCAITEIPLLFRPQGDDDDFLCSLDRIDSNGHYAPGNLQVICRFVNRWKSDSDDGNFRRLIDAIRDVTDAD